MKKMMLSFFCFSLVLSGCYKMRASNGGGQIQPPKERIISATDIALAPGYKIEAIAKGLTFPSGVTFDDKGQLYVIETGYSYGEVWAEPKLLRVENNGTQTLIAKGGRNGPWTGVTFYDGYFYVAEGGESEGGKILRISPSGEIKTIVDNLPSLGDHHTNGPVVKDGYIYFGQGTATNSAVVGPDNASFGWLLRHKDFHDVPCEDVVLNGTNYRSDNVLTEDAADTATTGAYSAFGTSTAAGQIIKGNIPCNGAIMKIPIEGGKIQLVAWGLRNPFGLAFSPDGKLFVTENAYDDRGSRPVWGAADVLWQVEQGAWYGWPDFSAGKPIANDEEFKVPGKHPVKAVLQKYPNTPPKPVAIFGVHSSSNGFDFSTNANFGFAGQAFVAQFGDMAPNVGKVSYPVGFKIVRVDVKDGVVRDFAVNKGKRNGPASWLEKGGLERPVAVKFDPHGEALYVVDFGILTMTAKGPQPQTNTGVIWKITKQ
ncbi:MAG TPA: PQQ-dependent sugar dehydrogenase [Parafilimonas sp.]|nr:PQQ-dependent sugar dehydrogenase [Parafilimonas sp.]